MKVLLAIGGIILILIGTVPLRSKFQEYEVQKEGRIITASLTKVPVPFGCKNKYFIKFIYAGNEYSKQVVCSFAENHKNGDSIQFRHKDGANIFLFPEEDVTKEFIASAALILIGISFIVYGFKKRN